MNGFIELICINTEAGPPEFSRKPVECPEVYRNRHHLYRQSVITDVIDTMAGTNRLVSAAEPDIAAVAKATEKRFHQRMGYGLA